MSSDNVTGYGVPLTPKQLVAQRGARTRPTIAGRLPNFELDEGLEATYRETVLLSYEDIDSRARKNLSDATSWIWWQGIGGALLAFMVVLIATSSIGLVLGLVWSAVGALILAVGFPYRRHELNKHAKLVDEAEDFLKGHLESGRARRI